MPADTQRSPGRRAASRGHKLISTIILLVLLGLVAAVVVPAFLKYQRRSKTSEATMNIRRIFDASVTYYTSEFLGPDGEILPRQFPATVDPTPLDWHARVCADGDSARYPIRPEIWSAPTWKSLDFAVEQPFYFEYTYVSTGRGAEATFTARARGDLDCDGVMSTYERIGEVDDGCSSSGGAGLFMADPLE